MQDARIQQLARTLVYHSCQVKSRDIVVIEFSGMAAMPLVRACIEEITKAGGIPFCFFHSDEVMRSFFVQANEDQYRAYGTMMRQMIEACHCYIGIRSSENPFELADLSLEGQRNHTIHLWKSVHLDVRLQKRWVVLRYPNAYLSVQAEMPSEHFHNLFFRVCNMNYAYLSKAIQPLRELMESTDQVRIVGPGTHLVFSIKGMPIVPCVGENNIPDGEIFTAPIRDSIQGVVSFNTPTIYQGIRFERIKLEFRDGRIVDASAAFNQDQLNRILDTDDGARYIGEFAIGLNPFIDRPILDPIFDEKIYGSFHLKPGNSYEAADNGNRSSVLWNLVSIQLPAWGGGEIYFDDTLVCKDGSFVHPALEELLSLEALKKSIS
ncbi:MAG: aminopeptidase [Myxococcales bacterium]|nr:aminopeptidase [Myxococcales bacterium]